MNACAEGMAELEEGEVAQLTVGDARFQSR